MVQVPECINGEWIYQKPICEPTECPQGVNIKNSDNVTESRNIDEVLTFECFNGINGLMGAQRCGEDGKWIEEQACPAEVYPAKFITIVNYGQALSTNCTEACLNDTRCSFAGPATSSKCNLFEEPIFFIGFAQTLSDCFQLCKKDIRCLTLSFQYFNCNLFSVNYTTVETEYPITDSDEGIIVSGF
ncbi:hypothetical protein LOTGIDRAFT_170510 [Lottia gigantea]|uniref:Sushi domain-containing protein n=1 Tax=Lottia gigantea TaxID=225164 RepID=V4BFM6_LOTGI|nr:hypothetical protein LOTGIDRAFT_170510 [Lottia gigantea]ESP04672.1 hypothetical protein LOTGIDRAFT_170510 [Lottia gigantea]